MGWQLAARVLKLRDLTQTEKAVLHYDASRADNDTGAHAFPKQENVAAAWSMTVDTVSRTLAKLRKRGYLRLV